MLAIESPNNELVVVYRLSSRLSMAFSEILRFVLPHHRQTEFLQLRNFVSLNGVKEQYFGNLIAPANAALPVGKDEMCWVIGMSWNQ